MATTNFTKAWTAVKKIFTGEKQPEKKRTTQRKYQAADRGHRTGSFPLNNLSPNKDIGEVSDLLRQRARYLYQNTPHAKRSINSLANGIVGGGILPTFATSDKRAAEEIKAAWIRFAESTMCDFNGRLTFYGLQSLVAKTYKRDGECIIMRRRVPYSESITGIQYQVLEMEYLATYINYQTLAGGGYTLDGIEYDKRGKVVAYWLFDRHPSEWFTQPQRYLARDVIHLFQVDYPGQGRGVTAAATTIIEENDLDEYEDAELMGKKTQASFAVARVTNDPDKVFDGDMPDRSEYDSNEDLEYIEPGTMMHLYPGESIETITPPTSPGAEDYRRSKHRKIAAGYEVTYEMMSGDYSQVNFTSGRMGWIEHQRTIDHDQEMTMIPVFCTRSMDWFLEQLPLVPGVSRTSLPKDLRVSWTTPRREMLDPVKETNAIKNALRTGLKSWSECVREQGYNPDEVLKQIAGDLEKFKAAGISAEWLPNLDINIASESELQGKASRSFALGDMGYLMDLMEELNDKLKKP